jgi:hypothetical protein
MAYTFFLYRKEFGLSPAEFEKVDLQTFLTDIEMMNLESEYQEAKAQAQGHIKKNKL